MNQGRILNLIVRASSGNARSVLMGLSYALADIARSGQGVKLALAAIGAVSVGFGVGLLAALWDLTKSAREFEAAMSKVLTTTEGVTKEGLEEMKDSVLRLSRIVPKSANELAEALYYVKSVVFDNADAMAILEISAKAATIALSDTETVAKVLTAAYVAYGGTVQDVTRWGDQLTEAVVVGRAEYEDFATQMGVLIGYGNTLSVSFSELSTWMAFLTRRGYGASQASVMLKNTMMKIINPAALAKKKYQELGIVWGEAGLKAAGGLIPYLAQLGEAVGWNIDELVQFFPNLRSIPLLMAMAQDYTKGAAGELGMLREMIEGASGTLEERFAFAMEITNNQLQLLKNGIEEVKIRLGNLLLPALSDLIIRILPVVNALADWIDKNPEVARTILMVVAGIAAFAIVAGGVALVVGLLELLWGTVGTLIVAVTLLGAAFLPLVTFFTNVGVKLRENTLFVWHLEQAWTRIKDAFSTLAPIAGTLWNAIFGDPGQVTTVADGIAKVAEWVAIGALRFQQWAESNAPWELAGKILNFVRDVEEGIGKVIAWFKEHNEVIKIAVGVLGGLAIFSVVNGPIGTFVGWFSRIPGLFGAAKGVVGGLVDKLRTVAVWLMMFGDKLAAIPAFLGMAIGPGSKFLSILNLFSEGGRKAADVLLTIFTRISSGVGPIAAIKGAFATLSGQSVLGAVSSALSGVAGWFASVAAVAAPFIAIVAAIAGVAMFLYANWDKVKAVFASTSPFIERLRAVFEPLIAQIRDQLKPLWDSLVDLFKQLQPILTIIGGIIVGVVVVALGILTGILAGVAGAFSGIIEVIRGVIEYISGFVEVVTGIGETILGVIKWIFSGFKDTSMLEDGVKKINEGFAKMRDGIVTIIKGLWDTVVGFVKGLVEGVYNFFKGLWESLVGHSIIPDMVEGIIEWFAKLPETIISMIGTFVTNIINKFTMMANQVINSISTFVSNFVNKVTMLRNQVIQKVTEFVISFIDQIYNMGVTIGRHVADLASRFFSGVSDMKNRVVGAVRELVNNFASTIAGMPGKAGEIIRSVLSTVTGFASQFTSAGRNFIQGMINGFGAMAGSLYSKARSLARGAINAIKSILGISSPSKVLAVIGSNMGEGMINGINGMVSDVKRAGGSLAAAAVSPIDSMNPSLSMGYGMTVRNMVTHRVEFGTLPEGLKLSLTAQEVADLLVGDERALKSVSRRIDVMGSREIR